MHAVVAAELNQITINISIVVSKTTTVTVQDILDSLMPCILALVLTFAYIWLLKKKNQCTLNYIRTCCYWLCTRTLRSSKFMIMDRKRDWDKR
ncbi:PTS system mannose/fructose/sorbose family transporter subunit IID [Listeria rocourtiae]|uniref:PTS system mannose/fructose/sorbose family transporter subunit IID n=1 Tax=Listeria rocourtiae TaxID=647910 RepID=UPI001FCB1A08|nr:PTS system mannose/fructose/sorbose family transporter subunit IID [Listeria rocourtiae]